MLSDKAGVALLATISVLITIIFPFTIYYTYPNTKESEYGLERVLPDMPVKPPPYLIGSMGHTLHEGRDSIKEYKVNEINYVINAYRSDKKEEVILVLLPYYLEKSSNNVVPGEELKQLIMQGNATLTVEIFNTHRGKVGVILEARVGGEEYTALRRYKW